MNTAVSVFKVNPIMPASMLRLILRECLPCNQNIDSKFMDNFRRRVAMYHAKNPSKPMVSMEECKVLASSKKLSPHDFIGMNDPIVRVNLDNIYAKILQNDSNVWSA